MRNAGNLQPLVKEQILGWADAHCERTGEWPCSESGPIGGQGQETWKGVAMALWKGMRGLQGGSLSCRLLAEERGVRNKKRLPKLTPDQILVWADAHHQRTGKWPNSSSGTVSEVPSETWAGIHSALRVGIRGLAGDSSLPRLLSEKRGVPNRMRLSRLSIDQVLAWADSHNQTHGKWPTPRSGPVQGADQEHWDRIDCALREGSRGLPGGSSVAKLLQAKRGVRNCAPPPLLDVDKILVWADRHRSQFGNWPTAQSRRIVGAEEETWPESAQLSVQDFEDCQAVPR